MQRHLTSGLARLPDAEEPDPIEAVGGDFVERGVGDVVKSRGPSEGYTELAQPDSGIDLISPRIARPGHRSAVSLSHRNGRPAHSVAGGGYSMKTVIAVLSLTAALTTQACRSTGPPNTAQALVSDTVGEAMMVTVRGWVDAIDQSNRTVTLKGPRGGTVTLDVKDPKKLDAMTVGDPVVAVYMEALARHVKKVPGAPVSSHPEGTPSATVGREIVVTAKITAVDQTAQTVTIEGPRGNTETIKVKDKIHLQGVTAGDLAEPTYPLALALTLDRAGL